MIFRNRVRDHNAQQLALRAATTGLGYRVALGVMALILIAAAVSLDHLSKLIMATSLQPHVLYSWIDRLIGFYLVGNTGVAWSMGASSWWVGFVLQPLAGLVVLGCLISALRRSVPSALECSAFALTLGGAVGNVFDRFMHGAVTDFIYLLFAPGFPVFNVADCFCCVGVTLLILHFLSERTAEE